MVKIATKAFAKAAPEFSEFITKDNFDSGKAQTVLLENPHRTHAVPLITAVSKIVKEISQMTDLKLENYSVGFEEEWKILLITIDKAKLCSGVVAGCSLLLKRMPEIPDVETKSEKYRDWRKVCKKKSVCLDGKTSISVLDAIPESLINALAATLR